MTDKDREIIKAAGGIPKPPPRPKKQPKPLKRTAIKPKKYFLKRGPVRKVSTKQAEKNRKYEKGKRDKYEDGLRVCKSC